MSKFEKAFQEVLGFEGGYSKHEADRGGETKYGITESTAREAGYRGDMKDLDIDVAKKIYRQKYWEYENLPTDIAIECFDQAVNMGVFTANKHLQMAVNCLVDNEITVDGVMGPNTEQAVNKCKYEEELIKILNILQGDRYIKLALHNESQKVFIRGWLKRVEIEKE